MTAPTPRRRSAPAKIARPPRAAPRPDPARRLAWTALRAVAADGAYANLVLPGLLSGSRLDDRDRSFVTELVYGTLRATGTLDHVIGLSSSRPVVDIDPPLLDALRLGAYQLLRTRIPPHAAVAATVDLVRAEVGEGAGSFANAILRRVAEREGDLGAPDPEADPMGHLSITTAHPPWVVEEFATALGGDLVETRAALAADDERPEVHLVARPGRISRDDLLAEATAAGLDVTPGRWSPDAVRLRGGEPGRLKSIRDHRAAAQDEGSQLAGRLAAALLPDRRVDVLDMCAGPGGKAGLIAGLLDQRDRGDRLLAVELHHHRSVLTGRTTRGSGRYVLTADALTAPWRAGSFDLALLDAPCSGLGSLRRRPEARWRRSPDDLPRLVELQRLLLDVALRAVQPGGVVVYVVCSPVVAETTDQVTDVLRRWAGAVEQIDVRDALPLMPAVGPGPSVQLWPHRHGTDAIFLAALRRVATLAQPSAGARGES